MFISAQRVMDGVHPRSALVEQGLEITAASPLRARGHQIKQTALAEAQCQGTMCQSGVLKYHEEEGRIGIIGGSEGLGPTPCG